MTYASIPQIDIIDGIAVTTSLDIARYFDKSHDDILTDIRFLDISCLLKEPNFRESHYTPESQACHLPMYYITKDGFFLLLLFGFSCREHSDHFLSQAYIVAFEYAEEAPEEFKAEPCPPTEQILAERLKQLDAAAEKMSSDAAQYPQVKIVNGVAVTTSLKIAEYFDKRHDHVLRDIRNLEVSDLFRLPNFGESSYLNQQGKQQPMYHITKDGFIFLAMGFTGEKAAQIKEAYIGAFNQMEARLTKQTLRNSDVAAFISNMQKELSEMSINLYREKYEKYQRMYERMVEECIEMVSKIYSLCKEGFSQHEIAAMTHYREDIIALAIRFKSF